MSHDAAPDDHGEPGACFIPRRSAQSRARHPGGPFRAGLAAPHTALAGLVHHLAIDVERFWFRAVVAGEPMPDDEPDNAWQVPADLTATAVLDTYRRETELADAIIAATSLDSPPAWWPEDLFGSWRLDDLREILLHVIAETACHAGHLDAARELIDGRQWIVLTE
jgi:uncharacterized damage-inducible protein DinB